MEDEHDEIPFDDYLRIIYERKWIIISLLFAVIIVAIVLTVRQEPTYEATCTIMVEPKATQQDIFEMTYPEKLNIQNYIEILRSHTLAKLTLAQLRGSGLSISKIKNPEELQTRLRVTSVRNTDILKVSFSGKSPEEAALLANTFVDVLIESELSTARREFTEKRKFLEEQMPIVKERLERVEEDLKKFKQETGLIALPTETSQLTKELFEFDRLYGSAESEFEANKTRLAALEQKLKETQETLLEKISEVSSPYILELRQRLVGLETTYSLYLVQGLPESNPKLVSLKKSIRETKEKLVEETRKIKDKELPTLDPLSFSQSLVDDIISLRTEITAGKTRLDVLQNAIGEYEQRLGRLPAQELELIELEREREINANTYRLLMERYEEVRIAEAGRISNVRIIDPARPPRIPVSPNKKRNIILGIVLGIVVGFAGAFLVEYIDNSIKTPKDVERYSNLPILGSVPMVKRKDNTRPILITDLPSRSTFRESYRGIRTNLQLSAPDRPIKSLLVTSPIPQEGKTTVVLNLAFALSQLGLNTVVLDADMRKPAVAKFLGIEGKCLSEYLAKGEDLNQFIIDSGMENVSTIISKKIPPNPPELLSSKKMTSLLSDLSERYDFIIVDSPPVLSCTDAAIIASIVDAVLFVVRSHKTPKKALMQVKNIMERINARVAGVILNMVPSGRGTYGYYRYYHYYHYYSYHPYQPYTEEEEEA